MNKTHMDLNKGFNLAEITKKLNEYALHKQKATASGKLSPDPSELAIAQSYATLVTICMKITDAISNDGIVIQQATSDLINQAK